MIKKILQLLPSVPNIRLRRLRFLLPRTVRRSYVLKFGLTMLAIVLAISLMGSLITYQTSNQLQNEVDRQLSVSAGSQADALNGWITERSLTTRHLSTSQEFTGSASNDERTMKLKRELSDLSADVYAIHYVNLNNGHIIASTSDDHEGENANKFSAPWAQNPPEIDSSDVDVSSPYISGTEVIAFISPITNDEDHAIVLTTELSTRSSYFKSPFAGGYVQVVNNDGTVVLDQRNEDIFEQYLNVGKDAEPASKGLQGRAGVTELAADDGPFTEMYLVAYEPVVDVDWALLLHVPAGSAYSIEKQVTENIIILVLTALIGLGLVGATIGRTTARSISSLADHADTIASGQLYGHIPRPKREDELGQLYSSFGRMQTYLNTVADQADALARQDFEADVLEQDVPGEFGDSLERMRIDLQSLVEDLETSRQEAEQARNRAERLTEHLQQKASDFSEVMEAAADGDLTERMDPSSQSEAMIRIAQEFNDMMDSLERTLVSVRAFGRDVASSSLEATASADEVREAGAVVSESIQEISDGSQRQNESLQQTTDEISDMSATIEEVASSADQVARTSQRAAERSKMGREAAEDAIDEMDEIQAKTQATAEEITALNNEMDRIGEIVEVIRKIAEQTNVLALNASIEAARAGEAGEGFAVVSEEVKQLAEETKESAREIEELIDSTQNQTESTVQEIRETRTQVEDGVDAVEDALSALDDIVESVEEANIGIQQINDATDEQAASAQEIVSMVDEVAAISEEATAKAQNVAATAEEQASALTKVSERTERLADGSNELRSLLDQFTVRNEMDVNVEETALSDAESEAEFNFDDEESITLDQDESVNFSQNG